MRDWRAMRLDRQESVLEAITKRLLGLEYLSLKIRAHGWDISGPIRTSSRRFIDFFPTFNNAPCEPQQVGSNDISIWKR